MILSVSRRTDIPAYYSKWFINRLRSGFLYVRNPMNAHQVSRIPLSPDVVDCIVFWTKDPSNMMEHLDCLQDYNYYFQFTLTGYGRDVEPGLADKRSVLIPVFQRLAETIGKERVIWRYDPIFINKRYTAAYHIKAFEEIARSLRDHTCRAIISFLDIYAKTKRNAKELCPEKLEAEDMRFLAGEMAQIAARYHLTVETCAEQIALEDAGIRHGSCIDKALIERLLGCSLTGRKDKGQRTECGCMESIEVGTYHTCPAGCKYCYANAGAEIVRRTAQLYDADAPLLCGRLHPEDKITDRKVKSLIMKEE